MPDRLISEQIKRLESLVTERVGVDRRLVTKKNIYLTYPAAGGAKSLSAGDTHIDFFNGIIHSSDGKTEHLNGNLSQSGFTEILSMSIETDREIICQLDTGNKFTVSANDFRAIRGIPFSKLYITSTATTTKVKIWASTDPAISFAMSTLTVISKEEQKLVVTDKDSHFTGAIIQNAKEDENLTGLTYNNYIVESVAIESDQALHYKVIFWSKDTFEDTDLDVDVFLGVADMDLSLYGWRIAGAGQYYMDVQGCDIPYVDEDGTGEIHVSLLNVSATAKNAGATGEVVLHIMLRRRE